MIHKTGSVTPENRDDPNETYDPVQIDKAYVYAGSVLGFLIACTSHSHPLFKPNNASVFGAIEGATRGTMYSTTTKP